MWCLKALPIRSDRHDFLVILGKSLSICANFYVLKMRMSIFFFFWDKGRYIYSHYSMGCWRASTDWCLHYSVLLHGALSLFDTGGAKFSCSALFVIFISWCLPERSSCPILYNLYLRNNFNMHTTCNLLCLDGCDKHGSENQITCWYSFFNFSV